MRPAASKKQRPKTKDQSSAFRFRVMQSSGGSISATAAANEPVRTILSGPAGGIGALQASRAAGSSQMSSVSTWAERRRMFLCERDGLRTTNEAVVAGLPVAVSVLDIHTVARAEVQSQELMKEARYASARNQQAQIRDRLVTAARLCPLSPTRILCWATLPAAVY